LGFGEERKHELAVHGLTVRPGFEIKVLDDVAALFRVEHVSNFNRHGSKAALVVSLEFALIEYLN